MQESSGPFCAAAPSTRRDVPSSIRSLGLQHAHCSHPRHEPDIADDRILNWTSSNSNLQVGIPGLEPWAPAVSKLSPCFLFFGDWPGVRSIETFVDKLPTIIPSARIYGVRRTHCPMIAVPACPYLSPSREKKLFPKIMPSAIDFLAGSAVFTG